jgi:hypothetical protein
MFLRDGLVGAVIKTSPDLGLCETAGLRLVEDEYLNSLVRRQVFEREGVGGG